MIRMVSLGSDEHILMIDEGRYNGTKGKLFLTNRKLAFEHEQRGIVFKGKYSIVNTDLARIAEVNIIGIGPFKKIAINLIRDQNSFGVLRHEFNVNNPETWKAKIEVAKSSLSENFTKERETIIKEIVKIKCSYCGMLSDQNLARCPNCNSLLK